jgi:peptide/nickel transport system ATP-binding protein
MIKPSKTQSGEPYLRVRDLRVEFATEDGVVRAVDGISYDVYPGQTLAIVGESGSGKSVSSMAVMGLLSRRTATISGEVWLEGEELVAATPERIRELRGKKMSMIFQDPLSSLHPFYRIGKQLVEAVQVHQNLDKSAARARAKELLERVGIPDPEKRLDAYPHEMSGGMRQRVMIAMALVNDPSMIIADEPTTALDVTVQAQIVDLLRDLQHDFGTAIVLITHDLGVVADMADDVLVMYGGRAVETAGHRALFYRPQMPYTWGLLSSVPRTDMNTERLDPIPGNPPSLLNLPAGCVFRPRCAFADKVPNGLCDTTRPELVESEPGHFARCHMTTEQRLSIMIERFGDRRVS